MAKKSRRLTKRELKEQRRILQQAEEQRRKESTPSMLVRTYHFIAVSKVGFSLTFGLMTFMFPADKWGFGMRMNIYGVFWIIASLGTWGVWAFSTDKWYKKRYESFLKKRR